MNVLYANNGENTNKIRGSFYYFSALFVCLIQFNEIEESWIFQLCLNWVEMVDCFHSLTFGHCTPHPDKWIFRSHAFLFVRLSFACVRTEQCREHVCVRVRATELVHDAVYVWCVCPFRMDVVPVWCMVVWNVSFFNVDICRHRRFVCIFGMVPLRWRKQRMRFPPSPWPMPNIHQRASERAPVYAVFVAHKRNVVW